MDKGRRRSANCSLQWSSHRTLKYPHRELARWEWTHDRTRRPVSEKWLQKTYWLGLRNPWLTFWGPRSISNNMEYYQSLKRCWARTTGLSTKDRNWRNVKSPSWQRLSIPMQPWSSCGRGIYAFTPLRPLLRLSGAWKDKTIQEKKYITFLP